MITAVIATMFLMAQPPAAEACADGDEFRLDELRHVSPAPGFDCDALALAGEAYVVVHNVSLSAEPDPYVALFRQASGHWRLSAYGYRREEGDHQDADYVWTLRRRGISLTLGDAAVAPFLDAVGTGEFEAMEDIEMFPTGPDGEPDVICLDGSSLIGLMMRSDRTITGERHSCAGRTPLDEFAEGLIALVGEADPEMAAYLEITESEPYSAETP